MHVTQHQSSNLLEGPGSHIPTSLEDLSWWISEDAAHLGPKSREVPALRKNVSKGHPPRGEPSLPPAWSLYVQQSTRIAIVWEPTLRLQQTILSVYSSLSAAKRLALYKHKCDVWTPWAPTAPHSPLGSGAGHRGQKCPCDCPVTTWVVLSYCSFGRSRVQWDGSGGPGSVARGRDLRWASWRGHCIQWHHHVSSQQTGQNSCTTLPLHFTYMPCLAPVTGSQRHHHQTHEDRAETVHHQAQARIFTKWHLEDVSSYSWSWGSSPSTLTPLCLKYKATFRASWWNRSSELPSDTNISQILGKLQYIYLKKCLARNTEIKIAYEEEINKNISKP